MHSQDIHVRHLRERDLPEICRLLATKAPSELELQKYTREHNDGYKSGMVYDDQYGFQGCMLYAIPYSNGQDQNGRIVIQELTSSSHHEYNHIARALIRTAIASRHDIRLFFVRRQDIKLQQFLYNCYACIFEHTRLPHYYLMRKVTEAL